jgi:cell division protein FtsB
MGIERVTSVLLDYSFSLEGQLKELKDENRRLDSRIHELENRIKELENGKGKG